MHRTDLRCGHCAFGPIPWGAGVCRGCHAEIHYGTPRSVLWIVFGISFVASYGVIRLAHLGLGIQAPKALWIIFGLSLLGLMACGFAACRKLFSRRAVFYRPYRTR